MLKVIPWSEFAQGIAKHWRSENPSTIPIWNNPFGIVQYPRAQWATDILCFPCTWIEDGQRVGYTSVYNISDHVLRTRGVYVLPEYRGRGIGPKMMRASWDLFPNTFYRAVEWFKESDTDWHGMKRVPGTALEWSSFSKCTLELCYEDWAPRSSRTDVSRRFIDAFKLYSLQYRLYSEGSDLDAYFDRHAGDYRQRTFDLNFGQT
jgi:GNAT superfamily N-acetyltransferase